MKLGWSIYITSILTFHEKIDINSRDEFEYFNYDNTLKFANCHNIESLRRKYISVLSKWYYMHSSISHNYNYYSRVLLVSYLISVAERNFRKSSY